MPESLVERLRAYVAIHDMKPEAFAILKEVLQSGELPLDEATRVTELKEPTA